MRKAVHVRILKSIAVRRSLIAACERLLRLEKEVKMEMDQQSRDWFMSKRGHRDAFRVAREFKKLLQ